jgi:hypothetical protein
MTTTLRAQRWADFRRRVDHAPEAVFLHRTLGWEYVPVHPFGDDPDHLAQIGIRPEDCWGVDAWWGVHGDATLLESSIATVAGCKPGLYARKTGHDKGWVYLRAVFELSFITREAFEAAMVRFDTLGFPDAGLFDLQSAQGAVWLAEVRTGEHSGGP